jgi:hypothetical protein
MAWKLDVWFGFSDRADPAVVEEFETKAAGITRGEEIIADGYTVTNGDGVFHHFPAHAVTHVRLGEIQPPEEEE